MSVKVSYVGRLGNNLFQYIAAYIFASKFDLRLLGSSPEQDFIKYFKLPVKSDGRVFVNNVVEVNDSNFIELLEGEGVQDAQYHFYTYYQLKEFVVRYGTSIKRIFDQRIDRRPDDEFVVHYRVRDIDGLRHVVPLSYYEEAIEKFAGKRGYIVSDDLGHKNVNYLCNRYGLIKADLSPMDTIDFAKNFNNIVLSEGTFSFWIGFLSNADNIYYNERERFWHGDIFVMPEWKKLKHDY